MHTKNHRIKIKGGEYYGVIFIHSFLNNYILEKSGKKYALIVSKSEQGILIGGSNCYSFAFALVIFKLNINSRTNASVEKDKRGGGGINREKEREGEWGIET
ncbi:hypothetical protein [Escherichia coli]|uniref:hypothetical protein n=1 Tax=Escherichia coli TaxID=562 RepID=UPI0030CC1347